MARRTPRTRPALRAEFLEDRSVPATHTWTDGAGNNLWSDAGNWDAAGVPVDSTAGDPTFVVIPIDDATITQNIANLTVTRISFTNPGAAVLTLDEPLTIDNDGDNPNIFNASGDNLITFAALDMSGARPIVISVDGGVLTIGSAITGTQGLEKQGPNSLVLGGNSTYSGTTTIANGGIFYTADTAFGTSTIQLGFVGIPNGIDTFLIASGTANTTLPNDIVSEDFGAAIGSANDLIDNPTVNFTGSITNNGGTLFLQGGTGDRTTFSGRITGGGDIVTFVTTAGNRIVFDNDTANPNDFTNQVTIGAGTVLQLGVFSTRQQLPDTALIVFQNDTSSLSLFNVNETVAGISSEVAGAGVIRSFGGNVTLTVGAFDTSSTYTGDITQPFGTLAVVKTGTGTQILGGAVSVATITANEGSLILNGTVVGAVTAAAGGAIGGTGNLTSGVTVQTGGFLTPADEITGGTLTVSDVTIQAGGTLDINVIPILVVPRDRLDVTGTATLAGDLFIAQDPAVVLPVGTVVTVLTANTLTGTFAGLPEGAVFSPAGNTQVYRISYTNADVTLTAIEQVVPTATLVSAPNVDANSNPTLYTLTVRYADDTAIDVTTLATGNVRVTGPNGFTADATFVSNTTGNPLTATYTFVPPGGAWDAADNGTYTISVVANEVADTSGNTVAAGALGTFTVAVAAPPVGGGSRVVASGTTNGSAAVLTPNTAGVYSQATTVTPFPGQPVNVRTAAADVNGDGVQDTIAVTGPGTPIRITVISGVDNTTVLVPSTAPFAGSESFTGGGFVAAGDFDFDGRDEIVVTPDQGGGPRVTIFSLVGTTLTQRANFFGITGDPDFRGGARPAVGDVNGDGDPDLAVAAGFLGGPRVALFSGTTILTAPTKLVNDFFAFPGTDATTLRNGSFVAIGDLNGDGFGDMIFGSGPGGSPRVFALNGQLIAAGNIAGAYAAPVLNFFVNGNDRDRGGVRVGTADADGDLRDDLIVASGEGSPARVRVYLGKSITSADEPAGAQDLTVFGGATLANGVFVG